MNTYKVFNACRKNLVTTIEWENTKKYNDLIQVLKGTDLLKECNEVRVSVENFGLAFSIVDAVKGNEVCYLVLSVEGD